ncbi:ribonuclease Z [Micromonospora sp. WMMD882]|uniref:ribonuclease Z n=1 Tax=Micromonospora sp. WMMD882 TaxID=3015151 RepID=UPI00248CFF63|nr:ribonuclease Z [Micromonospora sp. WMMD882]WBB77421.1 ribonuclease Z [Micromonospora sp. WMMD882]
MSMRELTVLGTASQTPTRRRNHNGYVLRWDDEVILFDPGEGSQRQLLHSTVSATDLTRICVTHFHGDHALGLPGVIQRLSLDRVPHPVAVHFPAGGAEFFARLRHATSFHETAELRPGPITADGQRVTLRGGHTLTARRLRHPVETYGYQVVEPDGWRMDPARLAAYGIGGRAVGELRRVGHLDLDGRRVRRDEVAEPRPGQRFAFVMDTGLCDAVYALAEHADLLVIESTFLESEAALAAEVGHLTAAQAGRVAAESGVRRLVLTHFSQRYADPARFAAEAGAHFTGELVVAEDLSTVAVPARRVPSAG